MISLGFSNHVELRAAHRNLSADEIGYVIWYGECFHLAGALIYFLRDQDVPPFDRSTDQWMRLAGTAVIVSKDGRTIITAWRNRRRGLKHIKHKSKMDLQPWRWRQQTNADL